MITLDPKRSAFVVIDLQKGILGMPVQPRPATQVLETARALAGRFRAAGATVVLVNVAFSPDFADAAPGLVDRPTPRPEGGLPPAFSQLADGLQEPGDLTITKRQWGAFTGTALDQQMRRRGIDTLVIGGIATNFGVESTARHAWELGYNVVIVEDACTTTAPVELHDLTISHVLPRIARVTTSGEMELG